MIDDKIIDEAGKLLFKFTLAQDKYDKVCEKVIDKYKKLWKQNNFPEEIIIDEDTHKPFRVFAYDNVESIVEKVTLLDNNELKLDVKTVSTGKVWKYVDKNFIKKEYLIPVLSLAFLQMKKISNEN